MNANSAKMRTSKPVHPVAATLGLGSVGNVRLAAPSTKATVAGLGPSDPALAPTLPGSVRITSEQMDAPESGPVGARATVLPEIALGEGEVPVLRHEARPRYRALASLGEGGFGEVALAADEDIGRRVAIKRLHQGGPRAAMMRFVDEVRVMGRLDHPNIVPVHDVGTDEHGDLYFVMKQLDGETLESLIERLRDGDRVLHAQYPITVRVQIFLAILRAVQFAHAQRIVHRDIKPANVVVGAYGEVVLIDWGIAKRLDDPISAALDRAAPATDDPTPDAPRRRFRTRVGALLGTPAYMSPEQARGDNQLVDERSDLYGLAVLFYELLTLRHPLEHLDDLSSVLDGVRHHEPPHACFVQAPHQQGISMELANFVAKGMAKQPDDRFQSASEMIEQLLRIVEGRFEISCPVTLTKRSLLGLTRVVDAHPKLVMVGAVMTVLCAIAAVAVGMVQLWA